MAGVSRNCWSPAHSAWRTTTKQIPCWRIGALTDRAEQIYQRLPANARDAFFELVLYPTKACAIVNELYIAAARNRLYADQGRASANDYAARVRELFQADADWSATYNHTLAGGKWDHMMDQTHIGYTGWQEPPVNVMPQVTTIEPGQDSAMDVTPLALQFDAFNQPKRHIDIFSCGRTPFPFTATASAPWIVLSKNRGTVGKDERLWVSVDWSKAPQGSAMVL